MAEPTPPDPESEAAQDAILGWLGEQLVFDAAARFRQQDLEAAARQEGHAELLKRGVTEWNMWRQLNPQQWVDLGAVDLKGMWLAGARLNRTAMTSADLRGANLAG